MLRMKRREKRRTRLRWREDTDRRRADFQVWGGTDDMRSLF